MLAFSIEKAFRETKTPFSPSLAIMNYQQSTFTMQKVGENAVFISYKHIMLHIESLYAFFGLRLFF